MSLGDRLRRLLTRTRPLSLDQWFTVTFDDHAVRVHARPPGHEPWSQEFRWDEIKRVCFMAEGRQMSDGIYVFTSRRPESYVIPTEAAGGAGFWSELVRRGLFDEALATTAAASSAGVFCWPQDGDPPGSTYP